MFVLDSMPADVEIVVLSGAETVFSPSTRVVPKIMSNFFFACELGTADEGECGGRWNQLLCYP